MLAAGAELSCKKRCAGRHIKKSIERRHKMKSKALLVVMSVVATALAAIVLINQITSSRHELELRYLQRGQTYCRIKVNDLETEIRVMKAQVTGEQGGIPLWERVMQLELCVAHGESLLESHPFITEGVYQKRMERLLARSQVGISSRVYDHLTFDLMFRKSPKSSDIDKENPDYTSIDNLTAEEAKALYRPIRPAAPPDSNQGK